LRIIKTDLVADAAELEHLVFRRDAFDQTRPIRGRPR
jgi:hypothetical protein